jgi:hypothetical protein
VCFTRARIAAALGAGMLPLLVLVLVLALPILALETLVCTLCRCFEYSPDMDMYTLKNEVLMVEPICFIGVVFFVFVFAYLFCFLNVINILKLFIICNVSGLAHSFNVTMIVVVLLSAVGGAVLGGLIVWLRDQSAGN